MSDWIRREDALSKFEKACTYDSVDKNGMKRGEIKTALTWEGIRKILENIPTVEPEPKWIPFKFRELTEEEKEWHPDWDYMMDCQLPENEQEILVSDGKYVWFDTFYNDNDGCCLDGDMDLDGIAWMPLPEPWRGE